MTPHNVGENEVRLKRAGVGPDGGAGDPGGGGSAADPDAGKVASKD